MPSREGSNVRRLWRFRHALYKQKVTNETPPSQKDVKYEGRSGKVYENKGSRDKVPDEKSGICARLNPVLQKITDLEGQFVVSGILGSILSGDSLRQALRKVVPTSRLSLRPLRTAHPAGVRKHPHRCSALSGTVPAQPLGSRSSASRPIPESAFSARLRKGRKSSFSAFLSIMFKEIKPLTISGRISQRLIQLNLKELLNGSARQAPALSIIL